MIIIEPRKATKTTLASLEEQFMQWRIKFEAFTSKTQSPGLEPQGEAGSSVHQRICELKMKYQSAQEQLAEFSVGSHRNRLKENSK